MINPIKSPQEMLIELAGVSPRMAGGSLVARQFAKQIEGATKKFGKMFGREPTAEEMGALRQHLESLSKPTSAAAPDTPATRARAAFELRTNPNINSPSAPDIARDPFLSKVLTGRTVKGTYLEPKAYDVNAPEIAQKIEQQQQSGMLEDLIPGAGEGARTTPSADYFGEMSGAIEREKLGQPMRGSKTGETLFDKLKQDFYKAMGRFPTEEEMDVVIANYNPMRHQYGEKGASVIGERPPSRTGMPEFRERARMEGIEESALSKPPADYPQHLLDELSIQRGEIPGRAMGGSISPSQMRLQMGHYAAGSSVGREFMQGAMNAPRDIAREYGNLVFDRPQSTQTEFRPAGKITPFYENQSLPYRVGNTMMSLAGDPLNVLGGAVAPVGRAGMRALNMIRRNPIKAGMAGATMPATAGDSGFRSVLENR